MRVCLLGPTRLLVAGVETRLASRQRALLAILALRRGAWLPADLLADELWGESLPRTWANSIQRFVSDLRTALGADRERLEFKAGHYRLKLDVTEVDASDAEALIAGGHRLLDDGRYFLAAQRVQHAIDLWTGDTLSDGSDSPMISLARHRLEELRLGGHELLWHARIELGDYQEGVAALGGLVRRHPLRERLRGLYLVALYRAGNRAEALREFVRFRHVLAEETGLEPTAELLGLERQILDDLEGVIVPFGPSWQRRAFKEPSINRPLRDPSPTTDPRRRETPFIGRDRELAALVELVATSPIVTVVGPAGVGKSRLVKQAAATMHPVFADGVELCDLTGVDVGMEEAVLAMLGAPTREMLAAALAERQVLIVLDNAEQVLDEVLRFAIDITSACPGVATVIASRTPSQSMYDTVFELEPLAGPTSVSVDEVAASPAVQLYLAAQSALLGDSELTTQNAGRIEEMCRRLDGLPLTLELAASRPETLGHLASGGWAPSGIEGGPQPTVQIDLDVAVRWSIDQLEPPERTALQYLSALPSPFTQHAARAVLAGDTHGHVDADKCVEHLVDVSLLSVHRSAPQRMFATHQRIQWHAYRQLQSRELRKAADEAVKDHAMATASRIFEVGSTTWSSELMALSTIEFPVLAQTLERSIENGAVTEAEILLIAMFGSITGPQATVAARLGSSFLDRWPRLGDGSWATAVAVVANTKLVLGDYDEAKRLADLALSVPKPWLGACFARRALFPMLLEEGKPDLAIRVMDLAIQGFDDLGMPMFALELSTYRAGVLHQLGRRAEAHHVLEGIRRDAAETGSVVIEVMAELVAAQLWLHDDLERAVVLLTQALTNTAELSHPWPIGIIYRGLATAALLSGDEEASQVKFSAALDYCIDIGHFSELWETIKCIGIYGRVVHNSEDPTSMSLIEAALASRAAQLFPIDAVSLFGPPATARARPTDLGTAVQYARQVLNPR